jgi:tetrahydromethanopterin S-methyltransferase subunit D
LCHELGRLRFVAGVLGVSSGGCGGGLASFLIWGLFFALGR